MRENTLKKKWKQGIATVNGWCAIPNAFAAELMAHCGWDSLTIDLQHGLVDYQAALGMLQAIATTPAVPLARVPWREAGIVMKMLDAGAMGIICPMVNDRAQAEEFVSFCRYAPQGQRSFGPTRAVVALGADYGAKANEEILALAMIETVEALANLEAILATPGLDGIYIGPADLALSMGYTPMLDPSEPAVVREIERIVASARRHGLFVGMHCGAPAYAKAMIAKGLHFASLLSDARILTMKASELVKEMGVAIEGPKSATY
ncbi:MAG: aldolase/citrate lyase family protein [Geminicoccaceae bacterium]|nr:aldolase/citrate lyase family protein [Geminicoccaceae bacterium]MCX8101906.1 aldolase/citrate lyase family protein [Geminicoccaceae bacterium]MDW8369008.1 aldolase/citrate lyase family protein [Geminicoccaceae bacterium]